MPRFFTLQQAEKLLPEVESTIRDAISLKSEYQQAEEEWHNFSRRVTMLGGMLVDHCQLRGRRSRRECLPLRLKAALEKIHENGCLVKDLNIGVIDLPTQFYGEEGALCWR